MNKPTYLLGAGFSKALFNQMPLLKDLSTHVRMKFLHRLREHKLEIFAENFEELISYLYSDYSWKSQGEVFAHLYLYRDVTKEIIRHLRDLENSFFAKPLELSGSPYSLLLKMSSEKANAITFNYDTLLESCIFYTRSVAPSANPTFPLRDKAAWKALSDAYKLPMLDIRSRVPGLRLQDPIEPDSMTVLKLHGSANWFFSGELQNPTQPLFYMEDYFQEYDNLKIERSGLDHFIIPPSIDKSRFFSGNQFLRIIWQRAREILQETKELTIIGYSFPESDIYLRLLFKAACENLTKVRVADPQCLSGEFQTRIRRYWKSVLERELEFDFVQAIEYV